ncbi:MAG: lipoate protein ligase C-terminal domain-containing protein, partial [Candidatus Hodarchaeales archaeon]
APGGLIRAIMEIDTEKNVIKSCVLSGDFTITPHTSILDIEKNLTGISINAEKIHSVIEGVIQKKDIQILGIDVEDLVAVIISGVKSIKGRN